MCCQIWESLPKYPHFLRPVSTTFRCMLTHSKSAEAVYFSPSLCPVPKPHDYTKSRVSSATQFSLQRNRKTHKCGVATATSWWLSELQEASQEGHTKGNTWPSKPEKSERPSSQSYGCLVFASDLSGCSLTEGITREEMSLLMNYSTGLIIGVY